ncbi:MAG: lipid A deacylase LpxR family protein [Longimicrobiaceae bacterium]
MRPFLSCLLGVVAALSTAQAAYSQMAPFSLTRTFYWENDFQLSDRSYTNGLRYSTLLDGGPSWTHRSRRSRLWRAALLGKRACPPSPAPGDRGCYRLRTGLAYGQNFYTPENLSARALIPEDRPYGGFIYVGRSFELSRGRKMYEIEYDLGLMGPLALGESVQKGWHQLVGATHPQGWDNQIPNAPAAMARFRRSQAILSLGERSRGAGEPSTRSLDVVTMAQVVLGTPFTQGAAGATFRVGRNIPAGVTPRIEPTVADLLAIEPGLERRQAWEQASLGIRQQARRPRDHPAPFYGFAAGRGVLVGHNALLQGPVLGLKPTLQPESPTSPPIARGYLEGEAGFVLRLPFLHRPDLSIRYVARGPEFEGGNTHAFWAASVTF